MHDLTKTPPPPERSRLRENLLAYTMLSSRFNLTGQLVDFAIVIPDRP